MANNLKLIDPNQFIIFDKTPCDIYMKLNPGKFVKIARANEEYDKSQILEYKRKGGNLFYVSENDYDNLVGHCQNLLGNINKAKEFPKKHRVAKGLWSTELIQEHVRKLGISDIVAETVDGLVKDTFDQLKKDKFFKKYIDKIIRRNDYVIEHSLLISYVACDICIKMKWDSETTLQKLTMASLLHDCVFTDPKLARIDTRAELEAIRPSQSQRKEILGHPDAVCKKISEGSFYMPDLDKIILEHHEKPDGTGFPRKLSSTKITPLSCLFIMSEDFVNQVYDSELSPKKIEEIKFHFTKTYSKGNFRHILIEFKNFFDGIKVEIENAA
ncbi:MAG: HD domain-containing protein [Halobacteriovoraceae bacterium]|nr:HD domain-containing protein [Halobacteriovoraceae bacterium]MCB9095259.1 HD domain-containing protein [Halobacteriovoraceae bacterium]